MDERTPREIVAGLHEQIAAISPERAALVAAYEAIPRPVPRPVREHRPASAHRPRRQRLIVYSAARLAGRSQKAAARQAGISRSSMGQYEADFLAAAGGAR